MNNSPSFIGGGYKLIMLNVVQGNKIFLEHIYFKAEWGCSIPVILHPPPLGSLHEVTTFHKIFAFDLFKFSTFVTLYVSDAFVGFSWYQQASAASNNGCKSARSKLLALLLVV